MTRFVPNAEGSSAVVNAMYLPVLLLSGAFFPVHGLPDFLQWISEALPLSHLLDAMRSVFVDGGVGRDDLGGLLVVVALGRRRRRGRPAHLPVGAERRVTYPPDVFVGRSRANGS